MASSLRVGLGRLVGVAPVVQGAVFLVCDQPHVTREVIAQLIAAHRASGAPLTASTYGDGVGVPAVFDRSVFDDLERLTGPSGAKQVIGRYASSACLVPAPGGEVDVDTPSDYAALTSG